MSHQLGIRRATLIEPHTLPGPRPAKLRQIAAALPLVGVPRGGVAPPLSAGFGNPGNEPEVGRVCGQAAPVVNVPVSLRAVCLLPIRHKAKRAPTLPEVTTHPRFKGFPFTQQIHDRKSGNLCILAQVGLNPSHAPCTCACNRRCSASRVVLTLSFPQTFYGLRHMLVCHVQPLTYRFSRGLAGRSCNDKHSRCKVEPFSNNPVAAPCFDCIGTAGLARLHREQHMQPSEASPSNPHY